jgi:DNA-binding response OmpR family regulator
MENKRKVLIVEDEPKILEVIKAYLEKDGWSTDIAYDAEIGYHKFTVCQPDLVILDIMLGAMSGTELSQIIRARSNVPFIIITSKSREEDRLDGFYQGADDYVVKPFSPKELVARANAVYRRASMCVSQGGSRRITFDDGMLQIDYQKMKVFVNEMEINLTNTEYKLFSAISRDPDKVFSRSDLIYCVQGYRYIGDTRIIDAHIKNIRQKMEESPRDPRFLETVFGTGYKMGVIRDE